MKRTIAFATFALFVFVAVSSGSMAFAQDDNPLRLTIEALVRVEGSPVKGVEFEPAAAARISSFRFAGKLKASNVLEGLDELLGKSPFSWTLRSDRVVVISLREEVEPAVSEEQASQPDTPRPRPQQPAPSATSMQTLGYAAAAGMSGPRMPPPPPPVIEYEPAWANNQVPAPTYSNGYQPAPYYGGAATPAGWYGGYYQLYGETMIRRIDGAAKTGWLKINANNDTNFARYLHVLRREGNNWVYVGGGGKSFRSFHDPMELPVGHQTLRFEERRNGMTRYIVEEFEIASKFDREHALQYTIDGETFKSFAKVEAIERK